MVVYYHFLLCIFLLIYFNHAVYCNDNISSKYNVEKPRKNLKLLESIDIQEKINEMIRVDHAGERAAVNIYAGQIYILGTTSKHYELLSHMKEQEQGHLNGFIDIMNIYEIEGSKLNDIWDYLSFGLGAFSALFGEKGTMLATIAIEESIIIHYNNQIEYMKKHNLDQNHAYLLQMLINNRDEENEHRELGISLDGLNGNYIIYYICKIACQIGLILSKIL